jgi:signal transduction histidine kinase
VQQVLRSPGPIPDAQARTAALLKIDRASKRLTNITEQLLDVASGGLVRLHLEPEEVDLSQVVQDVVAGMQDLVSRAGSEVSLRASGSAVGHWDKSRLEQVATNLLSNALKFGCQKPIVVTVDGTTEASVRLSVQDQGIGIPPSEQPRIFERFQRAESSRAYGGFGLGLWIARRVVEAHGGTLTVASEPGAGATFTVELPRSDRHRTCG